MKHYESFRDKFKDCKKNGNLIEVDTSKYNSFPKITLVCLKYKSICHSGVCIDERIQKQDISIIDTDEDLEMLRDALDDYLEDVKYLKKKLDK